MQDETVTTVNRKIRLTADETARMLEATGITLPPGGVTIRIDGGVVSDKDGTIGPDRTATTISMRSAPGAAGEDLEYEELRGADRDELLEAWRLHRAALGGVKVRWLEETPGSAASVIGAAALAAGEMAKRAWLTREDDGQPKAQ